MKPLIFCLLVATSFVLQCILVNSTQNITEDKTSQVISIFLLCLSLVFLSSVFIVWMFVPCQPSFKLPLIFLSLNFTINLISTTIFSILYHVKYSIPSIFPIFSFLNFIISIGIYALFESPRVLPQTSDNIEVSIPKEQINIQVEIVTFTLDEPSSCSICLEEFIKDEKVNITPCNHLFHLQCLKDLVNNKIKNCPVCRGNLDEPINISPSP
jgi:hypothetical protein